MHKNSQIEVEIKSLLHTAEAADSLVSRMRDLDSKFTPVGSNKQLNHYFTAGNIDKLARNLNQHLDTDKKEQLSHIVGQSYDFSVRTRKADDAIIFVMKATLDDTTSSNGTARLEFESLMPSLTLDELDKIILNSDFSYQAKWSRERQEYQYKNYNVAIDKNAGYGYLAEFERIVRAKEDLEVVKKEIRGEMEILGITELQQDRLARMFDFYNKNWKKYYGTDKTFTIL